MGHIEHVQNEIEAFLQEIWDYGVDQFDDDTPPGKILASLFSGQSSMAERSVELRGLCHETAADIRSYANREVQGAMSKKRSEDILTDIAKVILAAPSSSNVDDLLDRISGDIRDLISAPPGRWRVISAVEGLQVTGDRFDFGDFEFVEFDQPEFEEFLDDLHASSTSDRISDLYVSTIRDAYLGRTVAIGEILSHDPEAARARTLDSLQLAVDVLNVFADLLYNPGLMVRVDLPRASRYRASEKTLAFQIEPDFQASLSNKAVGPLHPLITGDLDSEQAASLGFARASQLLSKDDLNSLESALLASMQWAGRATADDRPEEAFLLYAIALEALLAKKQDGFPISYRLRTRVAHLLTNTLEDRKRVFSEIGRLYGIRSAIVHGGRYEVLGSDLLSLRFLTLNTIIAVLAGDRYSSMTSLDELYSWFSDQLLK